MKKSKKLVMGVSILFFVVISSTFFNCGSKNPSYEERIEALEEKKVPDSILSGVRVYLYNTKNLAKTGQAGKARQYKDSLKYGLSLAESWYEETMKKNKPIVDSLKKYFIEKKASLSGLALADVDSQLTMLEYLIAKNWYIPALAKAMQIDTIMGVLLKNEAKAKEIRPKLIGTWKDVHVLKPQDDEEGGKKYKATDTRIYKFMKDGSFEGVEERHGQTTPYLKEDWKFISWGKYDLMGDTIYIFIDREKCAQQIFQQLNVKDNKWIKKEHPTYDSTFTKPRKDKDKFIVWSDLTLEFKKVK